MIGYAARTGEVTSDFDILTRRRCCKKLILMWFVKKLEVTLEGSLTVHLPHEIK